MVFLPWLSSVDICEYEILFSEVETLFILFRATRRFYRICPIQNYFESQKVLSSELPLSSLNSL